MPRVGLTTRIFVTSAVIVVLVLAIAIALTRRAAVSASEISLATGLSSAQQSVNDLLLRQSAVLQGRLKAYADNPAYRANFDSKDFDPLDYVQTAVEQDQVSAEWVQFINREGVRMAKSDDPAAPPDSNISRSALVSGALSGKATSAFGVIDDTVLTQFSDGRVSSSVQTVEIDREDDAGA